jgi:hypothetical protein
MQQDSLGNPVTVARGSTLRALDEFIEGYLAYETRAEGIVAAADADPDCCLANVYAGFLWMFLEAPDAALRAAKYLAAAERAAPAGDAARAVEYGAARGMGGRRYSRNLAAVRTVRRNSRAIWSS